MQRCLTIERLLRRRAAGVAWRVTCAAVAVGLLPIATPHVALAASLAASPTELRAEVTSAAPYLENLPPGSPFAPVEATGKLPVAGLTQPRLTVYLAVTAYTSRAAETDGDPCTTASGMNVCERNTEDVVATNFAYLPFGTRVRLPELFGSRVFQVQDRMNERYGRTIDIWMTDLGRAKRLGHRWTKVEIF